MRVRRFAPHLLLWLFFLGDPWKGGTVSVEYVGTLDDGKIFDSSAHGDNSHPLVFEVGAGKVINGFDDAVEGMEKGEKKKFRINYKEDYDKRNENLVKKFLKKPSQKKCKKKLKMGRFLD